MRRLLATTCLLAAVLTGTGQVAASAAENGVGSSPGTTGQDRACQATSENKGKSYAKGLKCAPQATLTYIGTTTAEDCAIVVSGTGLQPGSYVTVFGDSAGFCGWLAEVKGGRRPA
ncbi:MAG: hypothetical protein M3378_03200 [Actinomycetota bacterium]|nr:hypothetical protein [Actinomycetota bacterium]